MQIEGTNIARRREDFQESFILHIYYTTRLAAGFLYTGGTWQFKSRYCINKNQECKYVPLSTVAYTASPTISISNPSSVGEQLGDALAYQLMNHIKVYRWEPSKYL